MTLELAKRMIVEAGFKLGAGNYEDDCWIRAYSSKATPGTYGYPAMVVEFHKPTQSLQIIK